MVRVKSPDLSSVLCSLLMIFPIPPSKTGKSALKKKTEEKWTTEIAFWPKATDLNV